MNGIITAAAGFTAGLCASMGLGGGFVLMIYLSWAGMLPEDAKAANLMFFIPVALVSILMNHRSGLTDWRIVPYAAAAGSIGAVIGLLLSDALSGELLEKAFALLLSAVGVRELFHRKRRESLRREFETGALSLSVSPSGTSCHLPASGETPLRPRNPPLKKGS